MDLAEDFIKYVLNYVLENCKDDLEFLENRLVRRRKNKATSTNAVKWI